MLSLAYMVMIKMPANRFLECVSITGIMLDLRVKNNARNVFLRHPWELMWEDILKPDKPQQYLVSRISVQRVADDVEFDDAAFFLQTCRLVAWSVSREEACLQQV